MKTVHHEGNSNFRIQKLMASRQFLVKSMTHIAGKPYSLDHKMPDYGQELDEALMEGVEFLRPRIARQEALAKGIDPSLPADPVIDKAVAREAEQRRHREEAEAEALAIKEAAGAYLNEQHPLWGTF